MPGFRRASEEAIYAFPVGDRYLFKHYFENSALFAQLGEFYDERRYRFEVREGDLEDVRAILAEHGYGLVVVDDLAPFTVAVRKYTEHPENVFSDSVDRREDLEYHLYLMKDQVAVEEAERNGAIRIVDLDDPIVF